jgi:hypothetical protein
MMDETQTSIQVAQAKAAWTAPQVSEHGDFRELTRFTSGSGPDDGFFDPGASSSAV